jgi:hypothetical protein
LTLDDKKLSISTIHSGDFTLDESAKLLESSVAVDVLSTTGMRKFERPGI